MQLGLSILSFWDLIFVTKGKILTHLDPTNANGLSYRDGMGT